MMRSTESTLHSPSCWSTPLVAIALGPHRICRVTQGTLECCRAHVCTSRKGASFSTRACAGG